MPSRANYSSKLLFSLFFLFFFVFSTISSPFSALALLFFLFFVFSFTSSPFVATGASFCFDGEPSSLCFRFFAFTSNCVSVGSIALDPSPSPSFRFRFLDFFSPLSFSGAGEVTLSVLEPSLAFLCPFTTDGGSAATSGVLTSSGTSCLLFFLGFCCAAIDVIACVNKS